MIFGTFCISMMIHAIFMYPETSRKSLEEVDELFEHNVAAWRSSKVTRTFEDHVADLERGGKGLSKPAEDHKEEA
jgi:hypothetical protein